VNKDTLIKILEQVRNGEKSIEDACQALCILPYEDLGFAKLDHHRSLRDNFAEVIYCPGKSKEQIAAIFERLAACQGNIIATRASAEIFAVVQNKLAEVKYDEVSHLLYMHRVKNSGLGRVAVITAGTADIPVAEEAGLCIEIMGAVVDRIYDVGVAGIHRLLDKVERINTAQVIVVVAGMEGALASVVGGITRRPVIAVPTSVGYGANFNGLAALLAMLNTCASGVGVVNIDNGYGAAALAISILNGFKG
jgi:pyridinium-3,5-biscarboxylic acid mononucleotide synthase